MEEPKQDIKAQDTCALCLEKFRRDAKIYVCPKCGCTLHEKCLVQYLTEYNFNRCFCMSCNRFFPNEEMKEQKNVGDFASFGGVAAVFISANARLHSILPIPLIDCKYSNYSVPAQQNPPYSPGFIIVPMKNGRLVSQSISM